MACDMPLLQPAHLQALLDAPSALLALSRSEAFYEPFPARCEPGLIEVIEGLLSRDRRSFQSLARALSPDRRVVVELPREATLDWDQPSDVFDKRPER